ncbi:MAG: hypothetical protein IID43_01735, partial [Planctomycetes bacterium]|nr:hypothetical protein [Planctomycetota bacterium]
MSRLKELIEKRATLWESNKKILDDAEGENRDLKAEERQQWELQNDAIDEASGEIDLRKKQAHLDEFMDSVEAPLTQAAKPLGQNRGLADDATLSFDLGPPKNPAYDGSNGRMERVSEHPENWDRKLTIRPDSRQAASATREYAAALERYLLSGEIQTALRTDDDTKGGFLTTIQTETQMLKLLDDKVFMRQIETVKPPLTSATGMGVITIDSDPNDA